MRSIVLARKPTGHTVAETIVSHGVGALNVDATRIHGPPSSGGAISGSTALGQGSKGRWPSNLVLQHEPDCRCVGVKQIKVIGCTAKSKHTNKGMFLGGKAETSQVNYAKAGQETVAAWEFSPQCPVLDTSRFFLQVGGSDP